MSRLESLDRKNKPTTKPAAKPGLRFKPKVVARRSEQERKKEAPVIRDENKKHHKKPNQKDRKNSNKNGFRGQRGSSIKTEIVTSGPLSSTVVTDMGVAGYGSGMRSVSMSPTPEYFSKMKSRTREGSPDDDDDDYANDPSKIDLNKDISLNEDDEISSLFPIRPLQFADLDSSSESLADNTFAKQPVSAVKKEDADGDKSMTAVNADNADDKSMISTAPLVENMKMLNLLDEHSKNGKFMLLQLPSLLPKFKITKEATESENKEDSENIVDEERLNLQAKLRVHRSGKLSIKIGDVKYDVINSASVGFLQDAVKLNHYKDDEDNDKYELYQLGQVGKKIIAIPKIL